MNSTKTRNPKTKKSPSIQSMGGTVIYKKIGKKGMSALGKIGARARWGNKKNKKVV